MTEQLLAGFAIGAIISAIGMYIFQSRVERALRMMLDRRDRELEHQTERNDVLVERIITLRQEGFVTSRAGQVRHAPDPEADALKRAEHIQRRRLSDDQFLKNAVADIRKTRPDVTEAQAVKEARRLLEAARMEQPPE